MNESPEPFKSKKLLADAMLGRLARWLRILGYDTLYVRSAGPEKLKETALREGRALLTRNTRLKEKDFPKGFFFVHHDRLADQLREVIAGLQLSVDPDRIFTRCAVCNGELDPIMREQVMGRVPEYVWLNHHEFQGCSVCGRIYWSGSHISRVREKVARELSATKD